MVDPIPARHAVVRHRHETRRRHLTVKRIDEVTPSMRRLVLEGDDLAGFISLSPDDHIKLFLAQHGGGEAVRRDYTPRRYDAEAGELWIEFALHGAAAQAGPATRWAAEAKIGDAVEIGGPRGSAVVPTDFDWWWLIGDDSALPAIMRRVEELPAGTPVTTIVAVTDAAEEQRVATLADHRAIWVHRPADRAADAAPLLEALTGLTLPDGEGFVWIAGEAGVARVLRAHAIDALNHPRGWMKAAGYWTSGLADTHGSIDD